MADRVTAERLADAMPDQDPALSPEEVAALLEERPSDEMLAEIAEEEERDRRAHPFARAERFIRWGFMMALRSDDARPS